MPFDHEFVGLIGVNNAGKSSLLRALFEFRPVFQYIMNISASMVDGELNPLLAEGRPFSHPTLAPGEKIFSTHDSSSEPRITLEFEPSTQRNDLKKLTLVYSRSKSIAIRVEVAGTSHSEELQNTVAFSRGPHVFIKGTSQQGEVCEIDLQRLKEELGWLTHCMYIGPFRNAINSGGGSYYDLTVGDEFLKQFDDFKNGSDYRNNEAIREMSDELARIFGIDRLEISVSNDKTALVYMIDGRSYRGNEQGGGVSQFVIVAANVLVRKPTILLIDEPELNLHASLQRQFLALLARYVSGPVIFSTHSLGLARSTADEVLVVTRDKDNRARLHDYKATPSLSSTLGELGYGGLNDSAYKAVLLVEGVTEVRLFQELLAKFGVRSEVVILPLGGDNLANGKSDVELEELKRLSEMVFAVVDSERKCPGGVPEDKRIGFHENCKSLGIECCVLERRSIENYLDLEIARQVMRVPSAPDFGYFDKPDPEWSWSKEKNWRVIQQMDMSSIADTDLGIFIQGLSAKVRAPVDWF